MSADYYRLRRHRRGDNLDYSEQHGMTDSPEYSAWRNAKLRTSNPNHRGWANYGGRGIQMCYRWFISFVDFFEDLGPRPSKKYSLDRINNEGHYEPGNVRWATRSEQNRNRRHRV